MKIEDYNMNDEETIELTAALHGGTNRDESRLISKTEESEAKRKASEPWKTADVHHKPPKNKWR